ncbi:PAS/PAC sensor signal transduction histidine kinase [Pseudodesulfovibrio mercurii]|uniref:PAS/PAC sensor signal transduction histidine kinase n=1 Tax=Pseudodesulfovibrio mercurii TaxID=641491 RepID=F0JI56_9BACT|nr:PAS domain-containing sensor histidine kinase [Pseudodesulfovibrio mercurii]EGB15367.1 PAS/PAC sensor signal transduction histidine kinase [Pseudodesulfovibrio mercurii]
MKIDRDTIARPDAETRKRLMESDPALFRSLIEASGMAVSIHDKNLFPLWGNQAYADLWGYPVDEILDLPHELVMPPESVELYRSSVLPNIRKGRPWEGEYVIRARDGSLHTVKGWFDPIADETGEVTHVIAIKQDLSDVIRMREALGAAEKSLNFISDCTSDIFFRLNLHTGLYDYLSPSVERFSGYTVREYQACPMLVRKIVHPDWHGYLDVIMEEMLAGTVRDELEFQFIHKSGKVHWASQRQILLRDKNGEPVAVEGIATDITARKEAEERLRASEEKYRFLAENTADVIWTMDNDYRLAYATPSIVDISGYTMEELQGRSFRRMITRPSLRRFDQALVRRRESERTGDYSLINSLELEHIHKDGGTFWAETVIKRLLDDKGRPCGFQGVSRDVTIRREAGEAILASEARFRTLFEDSPISLWEEDLTKLKFYFDELRERGVTDFRRFFYDNPEGLARCAALVTVVDVNKATLSLLGATSKEELFGNLDKVLTESSMAAFAEEMILLASGGREYCGEITNRTLDGETIWVMVHFFVPDEYKDTLSRVIVSLLDVTPRRRAEEALMDSEERYRVLAENSQEGVIVMQNGTARYVNESMLRITGYSARELEELDFTDMVHPGDRNEHAPQFARLDSGEMNESLGSFRILTSSGGIKWVNMSVKPIMWGGREAQMLILTNITRYKALESELLIAHAQMENRVRKRTAELSKANVRLKAEAEERGKAQERIQALTQQLIRVQEDERQRISRDLHDNVAQDLSSIMLKMETLFDGHPDADPELARRGEAVANVLRNTIASVREIAYGLRPPALDQLGLVQALTNLCHDAGSRYGFDVDFFSTGIENISLDFDVEINLYRMVQEAVRNICRHAGATKAVIRLVKSHPDILIRIEDNGRGFPEDGPARTDPGKRMGLQSMEERARLIGGSLEIQTLTGTGTRILFKVPIESARRHG